MAARGDGKFDLARKAYERALDIEPDYPPALYNLGVLYMDFDKEPVKAKDFLTPVPAGGRQRRIRSGPTPSRGSRS